MKIAIVMWPIMEPGGINTYLWNLQAAWRSLGHTVDFYHARERGFLRNLSPTQPVLAGRDIRLPGRQFKYGQTADRKAAKKLLNSYEVVVFGHQCPHPNIRGEGDRAWQELYDLRVPIITIFHDNIWDRAYPWFAEVAGLIRLCLYTNRSIWADSAQRFPRGNFVYTPQLLDTTRAGLYRSKKQGKVIWLPQWKAWKGIKLFVNSLPDIAWPVDLYNSGIEYHYLRKEEGWKEWIGRDDWTKKPIRLHGRVDHVVRGPILFDEVPRRLRRANVSVDLTGHRPGPFTGQTTYVHFESMVYGAVAIVSESVLERPSPIPPDCAISIPSLSSPAKIAKIINTVMEDDVLQRDTARRALSWVTDRFDDRKIASAILGVLERRLPIPTKPTKVKLYE